ncbi:MAG: signal peptidase I [Chloroflexi bacterium]|nr:signal peptidase I [Chloroflexota bacterium]|tara:strand:- start:4479 stop:4889 length:411 start_codon:yes stop_codon:yes gene_type:complete
MIKIRKIKNNSMLPTLKNGDYVFTKKKQKVKRNQIVIFNFQNSLIIKRVIGIAQDHILIHEGKIYLNKCKTSTNYLNKLPESNFTDFDDVTIPNHHVYVLGDNRRQSSKDSREIGTINQSIISEIVFLKIWPLKFL